MNTGLQSVKSKRIWFVPDFSVWGVINAGEIEYLIVEQVDTTQTILFGKQGIGTSLQEVSFSDLKDHRGNSLPANIESPKVIPRFKDEKSVFIIGQETNSSFKIARDSSAVAPIQTDLLVIEMGN